MQISFFAKNTEHARQSAIIFRIKNMRKKDQICNEAVRTCAAANTLCQLGPEGKSTAGEN